VPTTSVADMAALADMSAHKLGRSAGEATTVLSSIPFCLVELTDQPASQKAAAR